MHSLPLSEQVFALVSSFVEEKTGLYYGPRQRELFAEKLSARALEAGFDSLLDYYYYLRYDAAGGGELDALIDALVVPETYFFRELPSLRVLVSEVIAEAVRRRGRARVWSAACATGEEPLTLAMLLAQAGILRQVEVVASDLSRRGLEIARAGSYGRRSIRGEVPADLTDWLVTDKERVVVRPELRAAVDWRRINLLDHDAVRGLGRFDAVVCRNLLIYFRDETARRTVDCFADALRPDGLLLVGVSESLLHLGSRFASEERRGAFFYRKEAT